MSQDSINRKIGQEIAMKVFFDGANKCNDEDQLAGYATMLCAMAAKLIHGIEGQQVKEDFLKAAIKDNEPMVAHRKQ